MFGNNNKVTIWGAALMAITLTGCNSLQAEDTATTVAKAGATGQAQGKTEIKVFFDGNCPSAVDDFVFETNKGANIVWQAVKNDGKTPDGKEYSVYFDPFKGADIKSNQNTGRTNTKKVDTTIPGGVLYKYSIVGKGCSKPALDPFVRIL